MNGNWGPIPVNSNGHMTRLASPIRKPTQKMTEKTNKNKYMRERHYRNMNCEDDTYLG